MGLAFNIIGLMFCISFVAYAFGYPSTFFSMLSGSFNVNALLANSQTTLALATAVAITTALVSFPNPFIIFNVIAAFLLTFVTFPESLFNEIGMPFEIRIFLTSLYGVAYIIAVVSWFKGSGEF